MSHSLWAPHCEVCVPVPPSRRPLSGGLCLGLLSEAALWLLAEDEGRQGPARVVSASTHLLKRSHSSRLGGRLPAAGAGAGQLQLRPCLSLKERFRLYVVLHVPGTDLCT